IKKRRSSRGVLPRPSLVIGLGRKMIGAERSNTADGSSLLYFPAHFHIPARRFDGADSVRSNQETTKQQRCITKGIVGDWLGQEDVRGRKIGYRRWIQPSLFSCPFPCFCPPL
ncbi:hypothetical protein, partial [Novipirellula sp.]|uniref:hypothetical protein n=1 Tax=Novipirellula sp. TaxID=2795430 RepID=UPI003566C5A2